MGLDFEALTRIDVAANRYWKGSSWILAGVFGLGLICFLLNTRIIDTYEMKARVDLAGIRQVLEGFKKDHGRYPSREESLDVLVDHANSRAYFPSRHAITDPWGKQYVYTLHSDGERFLLHSRGPNGIDEDGRGDDITE